MSSEPADINLFVPSSHTPTPLITPPRQLPVDVDDTYHSLTSRLLQDHNDSAFQLELEQKQYESWQNSPVCRQIVCGFKLADICLSVLITLCAALCLYIFVLVLSPSPNPNLVELEVQEIMQWNANFGYCGEASFMHLGLRYGQYISQYDMRSFASPGVSQHLAESQLLLDACSNRTDRSSSFEEFGVARRIKLSSEIYCSVNFNAPGPKKPDPTKGKHFMRWLKEGLAAGYPAVIGVFFNHRLDHPKNITFSNSTNGTNITYHFHGPSIGNPSPAQVGTPIGSVSAKISHTIALPASAQKSDTQKSAAVKKSATEHAKMNSNPVLKAQKNKLSTQTIRNQMGLSNSIVMTPVIPGNRPLIGANMGVGSIGTIINMSNWHLPFNDSTGDADYDHIITVVGMELGEPLHEEYITPRSKAVKYHDNDVFFLADHEGLGDSAVAQDFPRNRTGANALNRLYSLNQNEQFGVRVYGIIDTDHSSLPVRLRILASSAFHFHTADDDEYGKLIPRDAYMELPDMHKGGVYRPALPRQVRLSIRVRVSGLKPGDTFVLCRYLRVDAVPTHSFHDCARTAESSWVITLSPLNHRHSARPLLPAHPVYHDNHFHALYDQQMIKSKAKTPPHSAVERVFEPSEDEEVDVEPVGFVNGSRFDGQSSKESTQIFQSANDKLAWRYRYASDLQPGYQYLPISRGKSSLASVPRFPAGNGRLEGYPAELFPQRSPFDARPRYRTDTGTVEEPIGSGTVPIQRRKRPTLSAKGDHTLLEVSWSRTDQIYASDTVFYRAALLTEQQAAVAELEQSVAESDGQASWWERQMFG